VNEAAVTCDRVKQTCVPSIESSFSFFYKPGLPDFSLCNIPKRVKIYQLTLNMPNDHKIYQIAIK
jgi:hypothetical protein